MSQLRRYAPFVVPSVLLLVLVFLSPTRSGPKALDRQSTGTVVEGVTPPGVPATGGDRRHCVGDRQFGGLPTAPPCQPDWTGKGNPGATYRGVTKDTVEIVFYRDAAIPALVKIQQSIGGYASPAQDKQFLAVATTFINKKYELWNRNVHIDFFQGNCQVIKPDPACFNNDAREVVRRYQPFGVMYQQDTNAPTFFQTLSAAGVVSLGGWHFPASYDVAQRPYHYDLFTDGGTQAQLTGQYWCRRLAKRPAAFAGSAGLRAKTRKAAIITVDVATNVESAQELAAVIDGCDPNRVEIVRYSPDTTTALAQSTTQIAGLKARGVTDLLWYSDPVAPFFFTPVATGQNYFPENVIVGTSLLDQDTFAQKYDAKQWAHAFGPSDIIAPSSDGGPDTNLVWTQGGGTGPSTRAQALTWEYLSLLAAGLQQAGPNLTPAQFERGLLSLPATGGDPGHPLVKFGPGDYTAVSDARSVAFSATRLSPANGKPGTYVPLDGNRRFTADAWPRTEPAVGSVQPVTG